MFLFKNPAENEIEKLFPDLFLIFKKASYKVETSGEHLSFDILVVLDLGIQQKQTVWSFRLLIQK